MKSQCRTLVLVLGDQLNLDSSALRAADKSNDVIWMAEVGEESKHVWTHKARIAIFLAAMRHFRDTLVREGFRVDYRALDDRTARESLSDELGKAIRKFHPEQLVVVQPGEWRVLQAFKQCAREFDVPLEILEDDHFVCSLKDFEEHKCQRKQLRMEFFYRELRRRTGVLMKNDQPVGGEWNYDSENRKSFGKQGPEERRKVIGFSPNKTTRKVLDMVARRFSDHPGSLDHFDWPVTTADARRALTDFISHRLPSFGDFQDAMWHSDPSGEERRDAYLFHSRLSAALNLKLLNPREVIDAAEQAYRDARAPLPAVEGFIRQILGWREYVRGVYWTEMPGYLDRNGMRAQRDLPDFYWTGDTEMNCLRRSITQTLEFGYAHHIQRLMVTGLFALLYGAHPKQVHEWYLAVYVDAVEWVELPNTLGMSQYADGGIMASKPYIASGKYIHRMSNYCKGCRFNPADATGDDACPFTTLYWDYLMRHEKMLSSNQRMKMQLQNVKRLSIDKKNAIQSRARKLNF